MPPERTETPGLGVEVSRDGLNAYAGDATGMGRAAGAAAATAQGARPELLAPLLGASGSGFMAAFAAVSAAHVASIRRLATALGDMGTRVESDGSAYDQVDRDIAGAVQSAAAGFDKGYSQAHNASTSSLTHTGLGTPSHDASLYGVGTAGAQPGALGAAPGARGSGVNVVLPSGRTVAAPNERAATAVRAALTQVGTPYRWGGNDPGRGLDCSGLTKYAYAQAGLSLPRVAEDQDIGTPVDQSSVLPGDLAVWDGHVAMVIGDGKMVEAGDPVSITSIRTSNQGERFHGFFRPTAS
ncbi:MAG: C40 family peptidase [Mycobacteriaceae bacterium]|nr:C40 family peptidase [Mycobacteriaceae bacterium]